jgi:hypothetical protein
METSWSRAQIEQFKRNKEQQRQIQKNMDNAKRAADELTSKRNESIFIANVIEQQKNNGIYAGFQQVLSDNNLISKYEFYKLLKTALLDGDRVFELALDSLCSILYMHPDICTLLNNNDGNVVGRMTRRVSEKKNSISREEPNTIDQYYNWRVTDKQFLEDILWFNNYLKKTTRKFIERFYYNQYIYCLALNAIMCLYVKQSVLPLINLQNIYKSVLYPKIEIFTSKDIDMYAIPSDYIEDPSNLNSFYKNIFDRNFQDFETSFLMGKELGKTLQVQNGMFIQNQEFIDYLTDIKNELNKRYYAILNLNTINERSITEKISNLITNINEPTSNELIEDILKDIKIRTHELNAAERSYVSERIVLYVNLYVTISIYARQHGNFKTLDDIYSDIWYIPNPSTNGGKSKKNRKNNKKSKTKRRR